MNILARRSGKARIVSFTFLGLAVGLLVGYVFIGSVDRVLRAQAQESDLEEAEQAQADRVGGQFGGGEYSLTTGEQQPLRDTTLNGRKDIKQKPGRSQIQTSGDTIHTLFTSNGSPYINFQSRIMYGTYKMVQAMPGGEKLVGFTRILHRTQTDILVDEVPTFRAEPLTPKCDGWCEFPVSDRANAVAQFLAAAERDPSKIKAPWLLMLEGDYVWMKPLRAPRAEGPAASWAFPYTYIMPSYPSLEDIMRIMYPASNGPLAAVPNSGPAPVLMRVAEWRKVVPEWERLTAHIEAHNETRERLGWVREMYAFSIAAALQASSPLLLDLGVKLELEPPPDSPLLAQPPADRVQGHAALLHYTWGIFVEDAAKARVWAFDKREFTAPEIERKPPKIPMPPPYKPGWKLREGGDYDASLANLTTAMLTQMNKAIDRLPELGTS